jgi:hypothetical protein
MQVGSVPIGIADHACAFAGQSELTASEEVLVLRRRLHPGFLAA